MDISPNVCVQTELTLKTYKIVWLKFQLKFIFYCMQMPRHMIIITCQYISRLLHLLAVACAGHLY